MKKHKIINYAIVFASIVSSLVYLSAFISPSIFWGLYFLAYGIPIVMFFQIIGTIIILRNKVTKLIGLTWFFSTLPLLYFATSTLGMGIFSGENSKTDFYVLNYNVSNFDNTHSTRSAMEMDASKDAITNEELIRQISNVSADIICLQEFYHCETSIIYNSIESIRKKFPYYSLSVDTIKVNKSLHGIAIFSKFPIISSGNIFVSSNLFNRASYADVIIARDTIRIINVHFQSNQIKKNNPLHQKNINEMEHQSMTVLTKIKKNLTTRLAQADLVQSSVYDSKYPVIVCGDFNETPYGYIYNKFRRSMNNSFTSKGAGFGFTFHSHSLFFLRIDQQFYSDNLSCKQHSVVKDFNMSDHYPVLGGYSVNTSSLKQ